jgi:hypothetical protein
MAPAIVPSTLLRLPGLLTSSSLDGLDVSILCNLALASIETGTLFKEVAV